MKLKQMKKLIFFLSFIISGSLISQSLEITYADTVVEGHASLSSDVYGYIHVKNVGSTDQSYKVKRIDKNYNALTDSNAICWDVCYQTSVSVSPTAIPINVGDSYTGFSGHVYPDMDGTPISGPITYVFFASEDPNDSVAFTVTYSLTPNFSVEEEKVDVVSIYPNPASDWLTVKYSGNSMNRSFSIKNIVGKAVYTRQLSNNYNEYRIDVSSFIPGVYFYELKEDGKAVETKKLIIR